MISFEDNTLTVVIDRFVGDLSSAPLLWRFLKSAYESPIFISKELLVRNLWPGESYNPKFHDPRIFDLAKRARVFINRIATNEIRLLSNWCGYKIVYYDTLRQRESLDRALKNRISVRRTRRAHDQEFEHASHSVSFLPVVSV